MEQRSARTTEHDPRHGSAREAAGQVRAVRRPVSAARDARLPGPASRSDGPRQDSDGDGDGYGASRRGSRRASRPARGPARTPGAPDSSGSSLGSALSRLPAPRLTGLGAGVFATLLMIFAGGMEGLLFDGSPVFYGTLFVLVCIATALWVRPRELFAAPVAAPLAYTAGQFFAGGPGDGVSGVLQNVFTSLALNAVWLYAGTLVAALIVLVRKAVLGVLRRNAKNSQHRPRHT